MFRSKFVFPAVAAALLLASQGLVPSSIYASSMRSNPDAHALKLGKPVKMTIANSATEPLQIMVGETPMTIAPGASVAVSAPVGTKIVNAEATAKRAAGEVLVTVSKELSGATLRVS